MPRARTVRERCNQVLNWMESEWPSGRRVRLRWRKDLVAKDTSGKPYRYFGETTRDGREWIVTLSKRECRTLRHALDTLMHEYTHVIQWGPASVEFDERLDDHPAAFWVQFGEILDNFHHRGGSEEASTHPKER